MLPSAHYCPDTRPTSNQVASRKKIKVSSRLGSAWRLYDLAPLTSCSHLQNLRLVKWSLTGECSRHIVPSTHSGCARRCLKCVHTRCAADVLLVCAFFYVPFFYLTQRSTMCATFAKFPVHFSQYSEPLHWAISMHILSPLANTERYLSCSKAEEPRCVRPACAV